MSRNSPPCDAMYPSTCKAWTFLYGDSSVSDGGCAVTSKASRCGSSHAVIGSTNGPVENSQRRTEPTPSQARGGSASERFIWPSAKLVSIEATPFSRVSLCIRKRS